MNDSNRQLETAGHEMHALISRLFPICRSMTGPGVRETLQILQEYVPLEVHEVPSGTPAFDWTVPREWDIRDAYIKDESGHRIVDFQESNLHVVSGSSPIHQTLPWSELKEHVYSLPEHPTWIPYRTCFHRQDWGFCVSHQQFVELEKKPHAEYEVCIDATLSDGSLTYGEFFLPGETEQELLLSCHTCHPSLANDNLSGIAVAVQLAKMLSERKRRYGYRFVFVPATIGPIVWLSQNEKRLANIKHGLVLALLGDGGNSTYKKSRHGHAEIDRAAAHVLKHSDADYSIREFEPYGYDERQYGSPGIDLPMGCLMRSPNGEYPEYHTSADNLELVEPEFLTDSLRKLLGIVETLEGNETFINLKPFGEPRLGRHGLYEAFGCDEDQARLQQAVLWVLNQSDGRHSLLDIASRSGFDFASIRRAADALQQVGLLELRPSRPTETNFPAAPLAPAGDSTDLAGKASCHPLPVHEQTPAQG